MIELIDHFFDGKLVFDELLAPVPKAVAKRWVASEFEQVACDGGHVASANEKTGFAMETDFVRAVEIVSDDRFGGGKSLGQGT